MSNYNFIFPGQGSQSIGMSPCILETETAKKYFDKTNELLGYNLLDICLSGPDESLKKTKNTQPAIFTLSIIIDSMLKDNNIFPNAVAGHSLGEYSALVSCDIISFDKAIQLVILRSREMEKANKINHRSMAAILNANENEINDIIECTKGFLVVANFNTESQIVISGEKSAILDASEFSKTLSKKRTI